MPISTKREFALAVEETDGLREMYEAPDRIVYQNGVLSARLDGDDGRTFWLTTESWPAPRLHLPMLRGFVHSTGPETRRRTVSTARGTKWIYAMLLRHLVLRHGPDIEIQDLTSDDVGTFLEALPDNTSRASRRSHVRALVRALCELELCDADVWEAASAGRPTRKPQPLTGYDSETFNMIVSAARKDVAQIVDRLEAGEGLLKQYNDDPAGLSPEEARLGRMLDSTARTGVAPRGEGFDERGERFWSAIPRMLFVGRRDLAPILILLAALSGRNSETLKELSAAHEVKDDRVLRTATIKRRRGYETETVSWEIGGPTRNLKTAGGLYLLLHRLCERSRSFAESDQLICVWTGAGGGEHAYPWRRRLDTARQPDLMRWAAEKGLIEDGSPLRLTFGRIKTTVDRDRAMKNDFDLDRTAVTNTPAVLYRSYVAPDPTARSALEQITRGALDELDAQLVQRGSPEKTDPISSRAPLSGERHAESTAYMSCRDRFGNPDQPGQPCDTSFLACFGCPCAVVADEHIPTLLRLRDELAQRYLQMDTEAWMARYGQAWLAINDDILPSRTPEEIEHFKSEMPARTALSLLAQPEMF